MQMKTIYHEKAAHLFLLLVIHVLVLSTVANAEVIEWFPDGTPQVVKTVTASGPYRYEEHIEPERFMIESKRPTKMIDLYSKPDLDGRNDMTTTDILSMKKIRHMKKSARATATVK